MFLITGTIKLRQMPEMNLDFCFLEEMKTLDFYPSPCEFISCDVDKGEKASEDPF